VNNCFKTALDAQQANKSEKMEGNQLHLLGEMPFDVEMECQ
jgi:hypothetical protein